MWAVNSANDVYYREGTYGGDSNVGIEWRQVSGKLTYVTSGSGVVIGVNSQNHIVRRTGVNATNPIGG